jgi:hypothetical protein
VTAQISVDGEQTLGAKFKKEGIYNLNDVEATPEWQLTVNS